MVRQEDSKYKLLILYINCKFYDSVPVTMVNMFSDGPTLFCSFISSGNYLCHYGGENTFINEDGAFSAQCFNQNKNRLSRLENVNRTFPYFDSSVGAPPGALRILLFA